MPSSTQVIAAGSALTIVVVLAQTAGQLIDFQFFHLGVRVLDSDHHASVFGALSILAEAAAAAAIGLRAVPARRLSWVLVAAVVGLLTLPRGLMHFEPAFGRYDVVILVLPLAVVFVVLCATTFRDAQRVRFMVWGSLVLLMGSFALHAVGPQADSAGNQVQLESQAVLIENNWTYQVTGMLKHSAELAGWLLLATAMAATVSPALEDSNCAPRSHAHLERLPDPLAQG